MFKIERVIFIVSKSDISINELCIKYDAIKNIVDINDDEILKSELSYTLNDIKESIDNYIDSFLRPELNQSSYFYMGKIKKVKRHSGISKLVSQICNDVFITVLLLIMRLLIKMLFQFKQLIVETKLSDSCF